MTTSDVFSELNDELLIKIILDLDLEDWGRVACVSKKMCSVLHDFCYKIKCTQTNPHLVSHLLSDPVSSSPPGGWAALFKVIFCCPGLVQVGVRVEVNDNNGDDAIRVLPSHLAWGPSRLSCEEGKKLLDDRFSKSCLYISNWSSCGHVEGNRSYLPFKGIFVNFKQTMIWKALSDHGNEYKVDLNCAFCSCKQTWDLFSPSDSKQNFGLNNDGEPVDRAFVCENGHVFGAWTALLYNLCLRIFCSKTTWLPDYS